MVVGRGLNCRRVDEGEEGEVDGEDMLRWM